MFPQLRPSRKHHNHKKKVDVELLPASESMEVSDVIANVPPIVEVAGDQNKETIQSNSSNAVTNLYEAEKVSITLPSNSKSPFLSLK